MKALLASVLAIALLAGGAAYADCGTCGDMSWWGNTGATPEPYKDVTPSKCKGVVDSGYWWWPTEPKSNANDSELWGNRGIVYGMWVKPEPKKEVKTPDPVKPVATRVTPVLNNVLFDFDKSVLKAEGKAATDKVVAVMKKHTGDRLVIEGHTCNVGEDAYNMGLGQRRADAVQKYMVGQGIAASRISTKSYGETKPAVSNDTSASRKNNRRAVFNLTLGK